MDYFEFKENLRESKNKAMPGGIRSELNNLQQWWIDHAGEYKFMEPEKGKFALYPILEPPFDMVRSGGILLLGYNPGAGASTHEQMTKLIDAAKKKDGAGNIPLLYDDKHGWYYIRDAHGKEDSTRKKRYTKRGEDIKKSHLNTKEWLSGKNVNKNMHSQGGFPYHRAFNKMLDDLGLSEYRKKTMATNFIPFNSKKDNIPKKSVVEKASVPWVKAFIKTSKPSVIFTTTAIYDLLQKHLGLKDDPKSKVIRKESNNHRFYQAGKLPNGTPVVAFAHWSAAHVGGPSNPNWTEENVKYMSQDIKRMMGDL